MPDLPELLIPCSLHCTAIPSSKMGLSPATGQSAEDPSTGALAALFAKLVHLRGSTFPGGADPTTEGDEVQRPHLAPEGNF